MLQYILELTINNDKRANDSHNLRGGAGPKTTLHRTKLPEIAPLTLRRSRVRVYAGLGLIMRAVVTLLLSARQKLLQPKIITIHK